MDRQRLINDATWLTNRLKGCLFEYYPEALQFFKDPAGKVALDFWLAYPTLEDARRLTAEAVEVFSAKRGWHLFQLRMRFKKFKSSNCERFGD